MYKFILVFLFLSCFHFFSFGQTENLNRLMKERQQIIKEYEYYNAQNSNFWGKKSKKDLLHIIDALKNIINKDSEIINEINTINLSHLQKQAEITVEKKKIETQVVDDNRVANDNFYDLKRQLQNLENRQKVKQRQVNLMEEKLQEAREKNLDLQKILAIGVVAFLGLVVYTFSGRGKRPAKKR